MPSIESLIYFKNIGINVLHVIGTFLVNINHIWMMATGSLRNRPIETSMYFSLASYFIKFWRTLTSSILRTLARNPPESPKMFSISDELAKITNPTPIVFDPEDDINENSLEVKSSYIQDSDEEISEIRRRTAPLLEDRDPSYAGKKISRRSLGHVFQEGGKSSEFVEKANISSDFSSSDSEEEEDDEDSPDDDLSDENVAKFKELILSQASKRSDEEEQSAEAPSEEDDDGSDDETQQISKVDVSSEIEKGQAVKNQKEIWHRLLEARILLQKLLITSNKLPQNTVWNQLKLKGGKELEEHLKKGSKSVNQLMGTLLNFNDELLDRNQEIGNISKKEKSNSDEEICSDTDEEMMESTVEKSPQKIARKRKYTDRNEILAKRFESLVPYRNSVIQKFDEKTRLTTGKVTQKSFNAFDNSALKQIEQVLCDKTRLIRRTQLKRSLYRVLGKSEALQDDENSDIKKQDLLLKDQDPEIFDDDDFYRQILKDLIESKSHYMDPAIIRKQMEIQKVRNKMKRKVDTKASKGRKLRFDVHPKMVNFMAPVKTCTCTDEERESFLKCLFGGKGKT